MESEQTATVLFRRLQILVECQRSAVKTVDRAFFMVRRDWFLEGAMHDFNEEKDRLDITTP
jgi:hypothetical protein